MRPEHQAPPEHVYNDTEALKYTENSRIAQVQADMAGRALELLNLPDNKSCFILDIGCGSGLSGEVLEQEGHLWVGMDISPAMLDVAHSREVEGDLFLQDIGQGMAFRPGTFDGCISISVLQWLCNADRTTHVPKARLARFFTTLYSSLSRGARAIFQFYPENDAQLDLIMTAATKSGFQGGLVVDYPNSRRAKKYFLCLFAGVASDERIQMPRALGEEDEVAGKRRGVEYTGRDRQRIVKGKKAIRKVKDKNWVLHKKEIARKRGDKTIPLDSKYTARKRKDRF